MSGVEVLVALAIAVGLVGILVPILPGSVLVLAAILVWAWEVGGTTAWAVFGVAAAVLVAGGVVKYLVPNRRLKDAGIPGSTQWVGAALGIVGFFVIPVVGLFIGFVLGVYLAEYRRVGANGGLAVDQARAEGGRAQHPDRARRRRGRDLRLDRGRGPHVTVLLSLLAAAAYGLSRLQRRLGVEAGQRLDGRPGLAVRRRRWPPWLIALPADARPSGADLAWALLAGLGNGFGTAFLYRGLSAGPDGRGGAGLRRRRGVRAGGDGRPDRGTARA